MSLARIRSRCESRLVLPETTTDQTTLELAITENLQREDLHPIDEAVAFGRMQRELGYSYAQIAERLGKSKGYVQNRLRLLQLDEDLQQLVAERPDTLSHVYELAKVIDQTQRRTLIDAVRSDMLSFAETRMCVQAILSPQSASAGEGESYLRKYDSDELHEEALTTAGHMRGESVGAVSGQETAPATLGASQSMPRSASLSQRERAALAAATTKVERYLDDLALLTDVDWAVLGPLALRLSDLLRQVGRAQAAARDTNAPDT